MITLKEKSVFIFDLDGTLYSQKKVRLAMAWKLFWHYLLRLNKIKELQALYQFRVCREMSDFKEMSIEDICHILSAKICLDFNIIKDVITKWMFDEPLELIKHYSYKDVCSFISKTQEKGKIIIIYSDYPVERKLNALKINPNLIFTSEDPRIHELKPSSKAMTLISGSVSQPICEIIYIGDRDEKDGASAKLLDISYCNIKLFRKTIITPNGDIR